MARPRKEVGRTRLPSDAQRSWEKSYSETGYQRLPWFSPKPSPWVVSAVEDRWLKRGSAVLDVGCGAGTNVLWLGSHGFRATGVDVAPSAVRAAISRAVRARVSVHFQAADALALPFARGTFTAGMDSGCFHTLPTRLREPYAREIARVLHPASPFLLTWVPREETRKFGPPHRPSVEEVASVFEPYFVIEATQLDMPRSRGAWKTPRVSLARCTARLIRRRGRQPLPR
ncbi:MAG: class I SAM-dependent methyltransferase [Thermoplasmata archaeon]